MIALLLLSSPTFNYALASEARVQVTSKVGRDSNISSGSSNFDVSTLFEFAPGGSAIKLLLPNTLAGLNSDVSNGFSVISGGLSSSVPKTLTESTLRDLNKMQQSLVDRYLSSQDALRRAYELLSNPKQVCDNLAAQSQFAYQSASQLPQQIYSGVQSPFASLSEATLRDLNNMQQNLVQQLNSAISDAISKSQTANSLVSLSDGMKHDFNTVQQSMAQQTSSALGQLGQNSDSLMEKLAGSQSGSSLMNKLGGFGFGK